MDFIQQLQEQYINEFSQSISLPSFLLNVLVVAILTALLRLFYIYYGEAISNRRRFASNFLPLALGTLLIITIVKSSIALSLGLVGALSIVRFRAAIKEPEELTYLFIAIGIGLAGGANQPLLAIIAFGLIVGILWVGKRLTGKKIRANTDQLRLHIQSDVLDLARITSIVEGHCRQLQLLRMDQQDQQLVLTYSGVAQSVQALENLRQELAQLSDRTQFSVVAATQLPL